MNRSVLLLAPKSFDRFNGLWAENQFRIITRSGHPASFKNLHHLFTGGDPTRLSPGWKGANPMAGYCLESFLKLKGYDVHTVFDWDTDEPLKRALESDPLALCFSTTYVTSGSLLKDCLESLQRQAPGLPIIVGGPYILKQALELQASRQPGYQAKLKEFQINIFQGTVFNALAPAVLRDAIYVASEQGEHTLLAVLQHLEKGQGSREQLKEVPNLVLSLPDYSWYATSPEPEPVDLNQDYPRWDLVDQLPEQVPLRTSVGCPHHCHYCDYTVVHPRIVMRDLASILAEMRLAHSCGARSFYLIDDNVFVSKKRVVQLTRAMCDSGLDIEWGGFFRADLVDEKNIATIASSGCRFALCGIESGDAAMLKRMGKASTPGKLLRGIELISEAGIDGLLSFIVGFPGEIAESIAGSAAFLNQLSLGGQGHLAYVIYPFYLLPHTMVDQSEYRREHQLTGRFSSWQHRTMSAAEAEGSWARRFFTQVAQVPYDYFAGDEKLPHLGMTVRNRAFQARKRLAVAFLEGGSEAVVQDCFNELYSLLSERSAEGQHIPWEQVLAPRSEQPGKRRPLTHLEETHGMEQEKRRKGGQKGGSGA